MENYFVKKHLINEFSGVANVDIKKPATNRATYNISGDFQPAGIFYNFASNSLWLVHDYTRKTEHTKFSYPHDDASHSYHTAFSSNIESYHEKFKRIKKKWSAYQGRESDRSISETVTKNSPPLSQTSEWEGYVEKIEGDHFYAKLVNITSNSGFPEKEERFSVRDLRESQRRELDEGSIIKLVIDARQPPGGQSQKVYELHIVETPVHTKEDISAAVKKAKRLLDSLNVKDDASQ